MELKREMNLWDYPRSNAFVSTEGHQEFYFLLCEVGSIPAGVSFGKMPLISVTDGNPKSNTLLQRLVRMVAWGP